MNLRGEFHVENVTTYDEIPNVPEKDEGKMDVDTVQPSDATQKIPEGPAADMVGKNEPSKPPKIVTFDAHSSDKKPALDLNTLYPIFWKLQASFSRPTRLFDKATFGMFKESLEATLTCFQGVNNDLSSSLKATDEGRRGTKRKRGENNQEMATSFNPKYLTNRDLFDLEIHDVAFRRHILVQALILLDFLLSLAPKAKSKIAGLANKSVIYDYSLSEEDMTWAAQSKSTIASYLQQGNSNEGKFYHRMVDTVLSRDKNWVRWKAENCPPIERPPISVDQYTEAQKTLERTCANRRLPPPPGASELDFLSKETNLETLKDPARFTIPTTESFYKGVVSDELDAEMGTDEETKAAREARDSKIWRALRASTNRFDLCEKIKGTANLKALSGEKEEPVKVETPKDLAEGSTEVVAEA